LLIELLVNRDSVLTMRTLNKNNKDYRILII